MKIYEKPQIEIINNQISEYCAVLNISSYEFEVPKADDLRTGMQQGSEKDDL